MTCDFPALGFPQRGRMTIGGDEAVYQPFNLRLGEGVPRICTVHVLLYCGFLYVVLLPGLGVHGTPVEIFCAGADIFTPYRLADAASCLPTPHSLETETETAFLLFRIYIHTLISVV